MCLSPSFILDAGAGFIYEWSDGSTTQTLEVISSGTYWVTVSNAAGCEDYDTITVTVEPAPPFNFPDTIQFCEGTTITIDAGSGYSSYLWHDGSTLQTFVTDDSGTYWCTVINATGCSTTDTVHVPDLWPQPFVDLGPDTTFMRRGVYTD